MIYCVWYPSGGFGHFINGIASMHGKSFARPSSQELKFSNNGNAHALELIAPKYFHDPENYYFDFDDNLHYTVLIDNGINNEGEKFKNFFPGARIIKICYSDFSWPVVAKTMIDKALKSSIEQQLPVDQHQWSQDQDWSRREKYFLFLRDNSLRQAWKPNSSTYNLLVENMFDPDCLTAVLEQAGIELDNFQPLWNQWREVNDRYIAPVVDSQQIIHNVKNSVEQNLDHITDLWNQAVLYYFLWLEFGQEVPHNDYVDFFSTTTQIREWLKL